MSRWFRFYDEVLNDPKAQLLPNGLFKAWVNILCLASKNGGQIIPDHVAFSLRCSGEEAGAIIKSLIEAELLDNIDGKITPHNWSGRQYDHRDNANRLAGAAGDSTAADRMQRHRNRHRNATVTPPVTPTVTKPYQDTDTDTDTEKKDRAPRGAEFEKFWSEYPRKKAKKAAEIAFRKARRDATLDAILRSLAIDAAEWKDEKFTPFPATWLNRGSYLDHAETAPKRTYRPPGVPHDYQPENTQRPTAAAPKLLDAGAGIRDEKPSGLGTVGTIQPRILSMGKVFRPQGHQAENDGDGRARDDSNYFGSDEST